MTTPDATPDAHLPWRISSFSGGGGSCVQIASLPDVALVRNSIHPDAGTLTVPRNVMAEWAAAFKAGAFDDLAEGV